MENNKLVIIGLLLIIIVLLSGILVFVIDTDKQDAVMKQITQLLLRKTIQLLLTK